MAGSEPVSPAGDVPAAAPEVPEGYYLDKLRRVRPSSKVPRLEAFERTQAKRAARQKDHQAKKRAADAARSNPAPEISSILGMTPDGEVLERFMQDFSQVTIIRGPWGSGKSVACVGKLFKAAGLQAPDRRGVRRSRWAVVRDSYPNLQETTIRTWLEWFPEHIYGQMRKSRPLQHMIRCNGPLDDNDGQTTIEMEVIFLALADEEDRQKLLSLELTGAWVNEAREIRKPIIDDLIGRVMQARFPPMRDGGATWAGVFMDTNAPSETHWLPQMMGEVPIPEDVSDDDRSALVKPKNWVYYIQPGALLEVKDEAGRSQFVPNSKAENIHNLRGGHKAYLDGIGGKPRSWIRVNFCNKLGESVSGKPVWPNFDREKHVAAKDIPVDPNFILHVGIDSTGRSPAAVFAQVIHNRWHICGELVVRDVNCETFAPMVRRKIADLLRPCGLTIDRMTIVFYRDPHSQRSDIDDQTVDSVFAKHGIRLLAAPGGNTIEHRLTTAEVIIDTFRVVVSPCCRMLIAACDGAYRYRRLQVAGREEYTPEPEKNPASNIADALQYLFLGAGEGRTMMGRQSRPAAVNVRRHFDPLSRGDKPEKRFALLARR
jgi:hypothetical protein